MIVLDSVQILAAVARALETHVLPELEDEFAAVQVHATLKALAEVSDRLQNGDPCQRMNERIEAGARGVAESIRAESPAYAEEIDIQGNLVTVKSNFDSVTRVIEMKTPALITVSNQINKPRFNTDFHAK